MSAGFESPSVKFAPSDADIDVWSEKINAMKDLDDLDSAMRVLACIVHSYERMNVDHLQRAAYRKALDWLATLKSRLEKTNDFIGGLRVLEYSVAISDSDGKPVHGTERRRALLYNTATVSDEEAGRILSRGTQDYDPRVISDSPTSVRNVFPWLFEDGIAKEGQDG